MAHLAKRRKWALVALVGGTAQESIGVLLLSSPLPHRLATAIGLDGLLWAGGALIAIAIIDDRLWKLRYRGT
jgi:hypothetical protein